MRFRHSILLLWTFSVSLLKEISPFFSARVESIYAQANCSKLLLIANMPHSSADLNFPLPLQQESKQTSTFTITNKAKALAYAYGSQPPLGAASLSQQKQTGS